MLATLHAEQTSIYDCAEQTSIYVPQHKIWNKLSFWNPQRRSFSRVEYGSVWNVKSHVTKEHCVAQKSKKMVIFFCITIFTSVATRTSIQ